MNESITKVFVKQSQPYRVCYLFFTVKLLLLQENIKILQGIPVPVTVVGVKMTSRMGVKRIQLLVNSSTGLAARSDILGMEAPKCLELHITVAVTTK